MTGFWDTMNGLYSRDDPAPSSDRFTGPMSFTPADPAPTEGVKPIGCDTRVGEGRWAIRCGQYHMLSMVLCDDCLTRAHAKYPQGWDSYPGDTCRHGVYTGGIGVDHMCGRCENGEA